MGKNHGPNKLTLALYLLPGLALFLFVVIVPIILAVYYSTFDWAGGTNMTFSGLKNYIAMMKDEIFWKSFQNNMYLTVFCLVGQIGMAFVFACLLSMRGLRLKSAHRVVSYFPVTLSAVVVGFVWTMIYDYNYGLINKFLEVIGKSDLAKVWLADEKSIMTVVSIPLVWQYIGMYLVIILAAMTSVSSEVNEMAELDGANGLQRAVYITLPLVKNTLIICVMLCISGNMRAFDHIYAMTRGGPGYSSSVMALYSYNVSFMQVNMGYGSALSIGILVISTLIVLTSRILLTRATQKGDV